VCILLPITTEHSIIFISPTFSKVLAQCPSALLKADAVQLQNLKCLLHAFSSMIGLHINFEKSTFVPITIDDETTQDLATLFG
jgi:hypothetical protein